jgi:hypothetical protein
LDSVSENDGLRPARPAGCFRPLEAESDELLSGDARDDEADAEEEEGEERGTDDNPLRISWG